jgi:hypothetical protein
MKYYLVVQADTNDADYVMEKSEISKEEIEDIKRIAKVIKSCKERHNWPDNDGEESIEELYKGQLSQEDIEYFSQYVPSGGEYGVHSIDFIELLEVSKETKLL